VAVGLVSCSDDDPARPAKEVVSFKDLKVKDDVLYNLELSYNERRIDEYDKLLDGNFVMIFSAADVFHGLTPEQWSRATEINVTSQMFDPIHPDENLRVTSIDCSLDYAADGWIEEPANQDHPGESWWRKAFGYDLILKWDLVGWERRALDGHGEVTIRWDPNLEHWRIVLWRDDVHGVMTLIPGDGASIRSTWGNTKASFD